MILDTSFLIDLMDERPAALAKARALEQSKARVRIPAPALFELWRGVHLAARSEEEARRVHALLAAYPSAPLDATAAATAGEADALLIRQGSPVDPEDSMIAGIALVLREPVLTRNPRHFSRIPGLVVETY